MSEGSVSLRFEAFGLIAEVDADDEDLLGQIREVLPPGWGPAQGEPSVRFGLTRERQISIDGARASRPGDEFSALIRLGSTIRLHVATHAPGHVFIHAGVVAIGDRGIVIPGVSRTGKTTLVGALLRAGARYYSDEYAVVDPTGLIEPFAKPLSIRPVDGGDLGNPTAVPEQQIATEPVRAGVIVLTKYLAGACWEPVTQTPAEGAIALLQNAVCAQLRPAAAMDAVAQLCRDAIVLAGDRGDADETAQTLLANLALGS